MVRAKREELQVEDILRRMEDAVENANLLAMELAVRALENEEITRLAGSMDAFRDMADRAVCVTGEISRLVRGFSVPPHQRGIYPFSGQTA